VARSAPLRGFAFLRRLRLDAECVGAGRRDPQQDAAAVVQIAPKGVERGVGLGGGLHGLLLGQPAGEQRGDDLGCGAAPERGNRVDRRLDCVPPGTRILLGPARLGR